MDDQQEYQELLEKYKRKMKEELGQDIKVTPKIKETPEIISREYKQFKEELYPTHYSWYEKACRFSENILKIKPDPKKHAELEKYINLCHLNLTPSGAYSFAILAPIVVIIFGALLFYTLTGMFFFIYLFFLVGAILIVVLQKLPIFLGNSWRMKASNQMVQCVFYVVTYMRHTSNLERAVEFASNHLAPPISLDLKKVLWDIETEKYSSIKESLNAYLQTWTEWNKEFVEAFNLIEASLYEGSEERRLIVLDKSLDVILEGTYEKMLHYAHNLKAPLTILHMLGIILPILGLVILPLIVSFMTGGEGSSPLSIAIYISTLYNLVIPVTVFYLGKMILSRRPTGYGDTDSSEENPELKKFKNILVPLGKNKQFQVNPFFIAILIFAIAFTLGLSPLILHTIDPSFELQVGNFKLMGYVCPPDKPACDVLDKIGPYGVGSTILSILFTLGIGLSFGAYYSLRSKNVFKIRKKTRELEEEFSSALFELGGRLGDGVPAELAIAKVAQSMEGTTSGDFFNIVEKNIVKLGMGLKEAIFDPRVGALTRFPSKVIDSSMKVLIESVKKGPKIAARALLSMSRYIKEIHKVNERLKDLLADVISSMKSQIAFLTPAIAGIVVGITSMVTLILTRLSEQLQNFAAKGQEMGGMDGMLQIFGIGMPTFYFQLIVGIYVIQITWILTKISSGIENGEDKLGEKYLLGKNMISAVMLYCILSTVVVFLFGAFASKILTGSLS